MNKKDKKQPEKSDSSFAQKQGHAAPVLDTDKAGTTRNPLHADLSEKPEKEHKKVRESEEDKKKKK